MASTDIQSLLALEVGEITTRALLFDVVEGQYRFIASGAAPTTLAAGLDRVIRSALDRLEGITGRHFIDEGGSLILPSAKDGSGADQFVATVSVGPPLKIVAVGLLKDISARSAVSLAKSTYSKILGKISIDDKGKVEERIDTILRLRPDLILVTGGTERGASKSVIRMVKMIAMACGLLPEEQQPEVLYAGNQSLVGEVQASLGKVKALHLAPNVRPDLEQEWLAPAQEKMAEIFRNVRSRQFNEFGILNDWADGNLFPLPTAFGRIIRFLGKVYDPAKGVLGIHASAAATTVAASITGGLTLGVHPQLGIGRGLFDSFGKLDLRTITQWMPDEVSEAYIGDYILNKTVYPASIPVTKEDLAIEGALLRQVVRAAIKLSAVNFPKNANRTRQGLLPWFEPIVAAGSAFLAVPSFAQILMILLDSVQPTGVTTLVLDQNNLSPSLGAAAALNPLMVVQVLESSTFVSLGTVISPVVDTRTGMRILRLRMVYESGDELKLDVKQGAFEVLPLPVGQSANLHLQPLHKADIGMGGPGHGGSVRVMGGALGVVIDARGRPLRLAEDPGRRRELLKKWLWTLGG
jgi:hypothetical protein